MPTLTQTVVTFPRGARPRLRIRCAPGWNAHSVVRALAAHRHVLSTGGLRLIQARHWRPVTRVRVDAAELAVKQYAAGSLGSRLRAAVLGSRARGAWQTYQ